MKVLFLLVAVLAIAFAAPARSATPGTSAPALGVGPHGWDYYLGTWTCTNDMPTAVSGPAGQTLTVSKSTAGAPLFLRVAGPSFDASGYIAYSAKTKTWSVPLAFADGSYSYESTTQTGRKTTWTGTYFSAPAGATAQIRDTFTIEATRYTDLTETKSANGWKATGRSTCARS